MRRKYGPEIAANLERAEASIQAAKELVTGGYYDFVASRAYYGAFYAATALLLCEEMEFSKHSGVIATIDSRGGQVNHWAMASGRSVSEGLSCMMEWWGGEYDPEGFDLDEANATLQEIDQMEWWNDV